jgi:hypothetical protein
MHNARSGGSMFWDGVEVLELTNIYEARMLASYVVVIFPG